MKTAHRLLPRSNYFGIYGHLPTKAYQLKSRIEGVVNKTESPLQRHYHQIWTKQPRLWDSLRLVLQARLANAKINYWLPRERPFKPDFN